MKQTAAILVTSLAAGAALTACAISAAEQDVDQKETQQRTVDIEMERVRECADNCYSWECDRYTCDARTVRYDEGCCQGRPLIVDGAARVAAIEEREDWV